MLTDEQKQVIFHMANYSSFQLTDFPESLPTFADVVADECGITVSRVIEIMDELLVMTKE